MAKLTVKQQKFADEYIISGNATQAALKAGYKPKGAYKSGSENLRKPQVLNYIEKRRQEIASSKIADQREIEEYLTSVFRGEQTESVATAKGIYTDVEVSAKDRVKAAELLGKRFAMWTENRNINANVGPVQIIDDVPDEDPSEVKAGDDNG